MHSKRIRSQSRSSSPDHSERPKKRIREEESQLDAIGKESEASWQSSSSLQTASVLQCGHSQGECHPISSRISSTSRLLAHDHRIYGYSDFQTPPVEALAASYTLNKNYYQSVLEDREIHVNNFIHQRFCSIYRVHSWAHDGLIRALIFSTFVRLGRLPDPSELAAIFVLVKDLRQSRLSDDVFSLVIPYLRDQNMTQWRAFSDDNPSELPLATLSQFPKSLLLAFVDISKSKDYDLDFSPCQQIRAFLADPLFESWESEETWELPEIGHSLFIHPENQLPPLNTKICKCGQCDAIQRRVEKNSAHFRHVYFRIVDAGIRRGCQALQLSWEPLLQRAEGWLDEAMHRVQCDAEAFPTNAPRLGPAIVDAARWLIILIGRPLSTPNLLRLVTCLRGYATSDPIPLKSTFDPEPDDLGYLIWVPAGTESDSGSDNESQSSLSDVPELVAGGNWLPELSVNPLDNASSKILIISHADVYSVKTAPTVMDDQYDLALQMPRHPSPDKPFHLPTRHNDIFQPEVQSEGASVESPAVEIHVSRQETHLFPVISLLRISSGSLFHHKRVAVKLSTSIGSRTVETVWRPEIFLGRRCEHRELYRTANRCSLSATEVLHQVRPGLPTYEEECSRLIEAIPRKPASDPEARREDESVSSDDEDDDDYWGEHDDEEAKASHSLWLRSRIQWRHEVEDMVLRQASRQTVQLRAQGGPFESRKALMIRVNEEEHLRPLIILAASSGRRTYLIDYQECWDCASQRMMTAQCSVGIATGVTQLSTCDTCILAAERAREIAEGTLD
ncbi:hypothetical protein SISSUDRAFT_1130737 [Sistotremastrum suecicum HHB10207 ss-3]|uniref:Uncharacterized protein n=1 Tax=Sistotremastrum suecicum HHB10207 ss-3 TaxID=1314776 RepID=A0A166B2Q8_9AGAM|nr:hypothetical protein SISSUDRAFT_1130737 [Sistotremastrum suecicum HHB10207 ss-3]